MAYPKRVGAYGLRPVKLINGVPHIGGLIRHYDIKRDADTGTRNARPIYNGSLVDLTSTGVKSVMPYGISVGTSTLATGTSRNDFHASDRPNGYVRSGTILTAGSSATTNFRIPHYIGMFEGCQYDTPDRLNYLLHSQYYPGGAMAKNATGFILDQGDLLFQAVLVVDVSVTNIEGNRNHDTIVANEVTKVGEPVVAGYKKSALIGQDANIVWYSSDSNADGSDYKYITGNSSFGVIPHTADGTPTGAGLFRIVDVVPETKVTLNRSNTDNSGGTDKDPFVIEGYDSANGADNIRYVEVYLKFNRGHRLYDIAGGLTS